MEPKISQLVSTLSLFLFLVSSSYSNPVPVYDNLVHCLSQNSPPFSPITSLIYTPSNFSYSSILQSSIQNLRFSTPETPKPLAIITPIIDSHVQAAVICCRKHQLQLRIRSGGHDYKGLSYTSVFPFVILDLVNIRSITLNLKENSVWVGACATVGELYYRIAERSPFHGFPAGICPAVGVGGHFSGGGFGTMLRKYGLAADNIIDGYIVDVHGRILDRESMSEGLFWAIRGGGGASFGVILSFKIKLVPVPTTVTVFNIPRTLEQDAAKLVRKWQYIGHKFDEKLFIRVIIEAVGYAEGETLDALINRTPQPKSLFKAASDFVQEHLPETALEELWKWCLEEQKPILILDPHIDLGRNDGMDTTYSEAVSWGSKYFKENFRRLAVVKAEVDPVAIKCSKKHNFEVRIRSGGHDYKGLSYTSQRPFVIIDLANLRKITINVVDESAWVEAGATIGELYYQITKKDDTLAFPAGVPPPTMGVGGHISGGGMGPLTRKFGLSADNVVDAVLVDVNGGI
ncbi:hypothetical protein RHMOL_Rhmol13G0159100 [Rhododendron molle]|uniref:Uncharacterized protein n=1 Tax=Rhododendron molle TaxID=49168 RepID=A0ACC0L746_RHOML|nr:hypothetical protein RHMOL_Rhmol13G0159100 [Rhododendron molle]